MRKSLARVLEGGWEERHVYSDHHCPKARDFSVLVVGLTAVVDVCSHESPTERLAVATALVTEHYPHPKIRPKQPASPCATETHPRLRSPIFS